MSEIGQLEKDVRLLVGEPDTTEMPYGTVRSIIERRALTWLNRRRPGTAITYFETVDDQQDYDEKPAAAYRVTNVWWLDVDFEVFSPQMRYVPSGQDVQFQTAGFNVMDNPSLIEDFYKKVSAYHNNFSGSGFETEAGLIRLEPVPGSSGDRVYFEYTYPRFSAVDEVPEEFMEGLRYYAASLVLDYLFVKRGMIRSGRAFSGGGGENERELAEDFRARAESEVPRAMAVFSRG